MRLVRELRGLLDEPGSAGRGQLGNAIREAFSSGGENGMRASQRRAEEERRGVTANGRTPRRGVGERRRNSPQHERHPDSRSVPVVHQIPWKASITASTTQTPLSLGARRDASVCFFLNKTH